MIIERTSSLSGAGCKGACEVFNGIDSGKIISLKCVKL